MERFQAAAQSEYIEGRAAQVTGDDRRSQRPLVDEAAACRIDDHAAPLHARQRRYIEDMPRLRGHRQVQDNEIGAFDKLRPRHLPHAEGACVALRQHRVKHGEAKAEGRQPASLGRSAKSQKADQQLGAGTIVAAALDRPGVQEPAALAALPADRILKVLLALCVTEPRRDAAGANSSAWHAGSAGGFTSMVGVHQLPAIRATSGPKHRALPCVHGPTDAAFDAADDSSVDDMRARIAALAAELEILDGVIAEADRRRRAAAELEADTASIAALDAARSRVMGLESEFQDFEKHLAAVQRILDHANEVIVEAEAVNRKCGVNDGWSGKEPPKMNAHRACVPSNHLGHLNAPLAQLKSHGVLTWFKNMRDAGKLI